MDRTQDEAERLPNSGLFNINHNPMRERTSETNFILFGLFKIFILHPPFYDYPLCLNETQKQKQVPSGNLLQYYYK